MGNPRPSRCVPRAAPPRTSLRRVFWGAAPSLEACPGRPQPPLARPAGAGGGAGLGGGPRRAAAGPERAALGRAPAALLQDLLLLLDSHDPQRVLRPDLARELQEHPEEFRRRAQEHTRLHAEPRPDPPDP
ncbi:PREDICTED: ubiquitin/ISG15-conjugating enzyme E2 L6 isoform X2 [Lepidothrix coronata]|uniref:Ubiquitin/ISG15-conjugating enzyme E2 L6 isoform X2 n=1 Tax=Lepidothrix coronata TaxID=321398 RepID=A0A6J0J464_9PASS|nr:PREDICTED: ubiquitin/ISG15-conjugating enzyme E2 L6 isoform X2 [Lepidothrix coronata]